MPISAMPDATELSISATHLPVAMRDARLDGRSTVFLHSSFRTGSTWLWQKLRNAPTTFCYYEIFNEALASLDLDKAKYDYRSWDSRHPAIAPYFLEFVAHLGAGHGVPGFDKSMTYDAFVPKGGPDGALRPAERSYLAGLIEAARSRQRIPVLSCSRTLGRARALKAAFGGTAVFLHRNLFHQWASYRSLAEAGNSFFVDTIEHTLVASTHDPFLRDVADWFGIGRCKPSQETLFQAFLVLHLYLYSIAFDASDLLIDMTAIAADRAARHDAELHLSALIGHAIDLSDVRGSCDFADLAVDNARVVRDTVEQFVKLIPGHATSVAAKAFVDDAKDQALEEWDRFEFFNRRTRAVLTHRVDEADARLEATRGASDRLQADYDRLAREMREQALGHEAERVGHREALRRCSGESDALREQLATAAATMRDLRESVARLEAERDTLQRALAEARAEAAASPYAKARKLLRSRRGRTDRLGA